MSFSQVLSTVFEAALVCFTVWAVFHEDLFIKFEEKIACNFKRKRFKVVTREVSQNSAYNLQHQRYIFLHK